MTTKETKNQKAQHAVEVSANNKRKRENMSMKDIKNQKAQHIVEVSASNKKNVRL